ncbi:type II toxin-antitoxin system YafQ family toxin [Vibrio sp. SS-MA-C1-2]|uniref:type II toxin-antitoxin system RelE/ParE family toxin n=1 Tax=Vibrio sp. SS-MA-C1-2 TaxID=2908646 RepID=UPI001F167061|nr:type II toxin-antitoxin system YafQ family toxin [Vibrio sp. SS-MA-C1-2]UJF20162.1 type II toxin-antitoxin system YafQ family toxin [Vibrio sp. SS-MA-C1-2]
MYFIEFSTQFKKDFKKIVKLPIQEVLEIGGIISQLQRGDVLDVKYVDHPLSGNWSQFRDCHIRADLVLIYRIDNNTLQLARIGSHSDLF